MKIAQGETLGERSIAKSPPRRGEAQDGLWYPHKRRTTLSIAPRFGADAQS